MKNKDMKELAIKLAQVLSKITEETPNYLVAREIMEEDKYSSFVDILHSMALQASKQKLDLIPADSPMNLTMGWADINSEIFWEIHVSDLHKSLKEIDGAGIIREALSDYLGKAILTKAIEAICNVY